MCCLPWIRATPVLSPPFTAGIQQHSALAAIPWGEWGRCYCPCAGLGRLCWDLRGGGCSLCGVPILC